MATSEFVFGRPPPSDLDITPSREQIDFFAANGYVVIERLTTDEELEWLSAVLAEVMRGGTSLVFEPGRSRADEGPFALAQSIHPEVQFPELLETTYCRNARSVAAALLGATEKQVGTWGYMLHMPPGTGRAVPWHQDEAYWDPELAYHAVGAWLSLHEASAARGARRFVPGSHRGDVMAHAESGDLPETLLVAEHVDDEQLVTCEVPAGGATFHHPRTFVSTPSNSSDADVEAYVMEFQTAPRRRGEARRWPWTDRRRIAMGQSEAPQVYVTDGRIVPVPAMRRLRARRRDAR